MKKIENLLFLPIVVILLLLLFAGNSTLDMAVAMADGAVFVIQADPLQER